MRRRQLEVVAQQRALLTLGDLHRQDGGDVVGQSSAQPPRLQQLPVDQADAPGCAEDVAGVAVAV